MLAERPRAIDVLLMALSSSVLPLALALAVRITCGTRVAALTTTAAIPTDSKSILDMCVRALSGPRLKYDLCAGGASRAGALRHARRVVLPRTRERADRGADDERHEAPDVLDDDVDAARGAPARAGQGRVARRGCGAPAVDGAARDLLVPVQGGSHDVQQGPGCAEREGGGHEGRPLHLPADWRDVHGPGGVCDGATVRRRVASFAGGTT
eukprot:3923519-Rhodomonas_salina.2